MRTFKIGDKVVTNTGVEGVIYHTNKDTIYIRTTDGSTPGAQGWHVKNIYLRETPLHLIVWDFICECAESFEKRIGLIAFCVITFVLVISLCAAIEANRELKCKDRWSSSGFDVQYLHGQCMVGVNKRYFPEDNIKVSTSAIEVDYE